MSDRAIQELDKRGQKMIATELVRANSEDLMNRLLGLRWKYDGDYDFLVLDQSITAEERANLLEIRYTFSPSGRALYEAMVAVVSERLASSEVSSQHAGTTVASSTSPATSADPPSSPMP